MKVEANGVTFEFADGTSRAQVEEAIDSHFKPKAPQSTLDTIRGGIASAGQGASLGLLDEGLAALMAVPAAYQTDTSIGDAYTGLRDNMRNQHKTFAEHNPKADLGLQLAGGLLTGGVGAARTVGANAAKMTGKQLLGRSAATGAALGGTSGFGYSEADTLAGLAGDTAKGAAIGGLAGAAFPAAGQAFSKMKNAAQAATKPYQAQVKTLERAGIKLTTAQKSAADWAKGAETQLSQTPIGGVPLQRHFESQRQQYQRKLWKMVGLDDPVDDAMLTRTNLDKAYASISDDYTKALKGKKVELDSDAFLDDIANIEQRYTRIIDDDTARKARSLVDSFLDEAAENPKWAGEIYQQQRSKFARLSKGNTETANLYRDFKGAMDRAFERAAGTFATRGANSRFAQFKQLEDMYERVAGGAAGAEGFIVPSILSKKAAGSAGSREWQDFTRAAHSVLTDRIANSGTAQRQFMGGLLAGGALFEPVTAASVLAANRALAGQMSKGRALDVTKLMPGGQMLMGRGAAPAALAGQIPTNPYPTSR